MARITFTHSRPPVMHRRRFLKAGTALGISALPAWGNAATATLLNTADEAHRFDYAALKGEARALARSAYRPPNEALPESVQKLDWDQFQAIRYRPDHALWANEPSRFEARFFHLGLFFKTPVRMYEIKDGQAREIAYDPAMFDYGNSGLQSAHLPQDLGFAGFQLFYHTDRKRDIVAFLGASYFRAVGGEMQYGLSTRGLAIDSGMSRSEEFPRFTAFWFERPEPESDVLTVYALMDSPSIAGAYRFLIHPAARLVMDVDAALYPRKPIERLGVAPLTSMFLFGENENRINNDWRPEIHDSDGLAIWRGNGEWIWRPLVNPVNLRFNAYADDSPRGFGLLQRDRNFDHYQDDGAFYERRPSLWVEPRSGWGKGSIQLVELPASDETFDNIVAFWNPDEKPQPGQELLFAYRLYWGDRPPVVAPLARVVATRTGLGGIVGQKRKYFSWRFAVDFAGGDLAMLGKDTVVEPVIVVSRGQVEITSVRALAPIQGLRAMFDLKPTDRDPGPINLRMFLRVDGQPLTETWLYQWTPPQVRPPL